MYDKQGKAVLLCKMFSAIVHGKYVTKLRIHIIF